MSSAYPGWSKANSVIASLSKNIEPKIEYVEETSQIEISFLPKIYDDENDDSDDYEIPTKYKRRFYQKMIDFEDALLKDLNIDERMQKYFGKAVNQRLLYDIEKEVKDIFDQFNNESLVKISMLFKMVIATECSLEGVGLEDSSKIIHKIPEHLKEIIIGDGLTYRTL